MLKTVQTTEAWLVKFQRGVRTLPGHLCEESVMSGQAELKNQLQLTRDQNTKIKPLLYWDSGCCSAEAKKLVVVKRPATVRWNLLESVSSEQVHGSCVSETAKVVPFAGNRTWQFNSLPDGTGFEGMRDH